MNELEASDLINSHNSRYSQGMCFKESFCVNILGKDKGTQVFSSAGDELLTSSYSSIDNDSLVNLPINQAFVWIVTLINSKIKLYICKVFDTFKYVFKYTVSINISVSWSHIMPANLVTFIANHLSPNKSFQTFYEINFVTIFKLYIGLRLENMPPTVIHIWIVFESNF